MNVLMDGVAGISDYQAQQLLDDRYHCLQIVFDPSETIALDAVDKLDSMDEIAKAHPLDAVAPHANANNPVSTVEWIRTVWQ